MLEGFKKYYSTLGKNLVKMLPKPPNKYSANTIIKYYEYTWVKEFKNGPNKNCGRQPLKNFTWSILEYLGSYDPK